MKHEPIEIGRGQTVPRNVTLACATCHGMSKHTPGPWAIVDDPDAYAYRIVAEKNKTIICRPMGLTVVEREANAQLISSAPDLLRQRDALLKACKAMKSDLEHYPGYDSIAMAESAISLCEKEDV